jgi:Cys-tRNA(Pro)/Cys-tRNA(Cys) deacylase
LSLKYLIIIAQPSVFVKDYFGKKQIFFSGVLQPMGNAGIISSASPFSKEESPMKQPKENKTNAMRRLEDAHIPYEAKTYPHGDEAVDGVTVARSLGQDPDSVFKTLVARGASGGYYVFDIPVNEELDLKKAAKAVGEKNVALIAVKELLPLTGYVRGGCSPIGMKKHFPTTIHETAQLYDQIAVSGGKIGMQVLVEPVALCQLVEGQFADLTRD